MSTIRHIDLFSGSARWIQDRSPSGRSGRDRLGKESTPSRATSCSLRNATPHSAHGPACGQCQGRGSRRTPRTTSGHRGTGSTTASGYGPYPGAGVFALDTQPSSRDSGRRTSTWTHGRSASSTRGSNAAGCCWTGRSVYRTGDRSDHQLRVLSPFSHGSDGSGRDGSSTCLEHGPPGMRCHRRRRTLCDLATFGVLSLHKVYQMPEGGDAP